MKRTVDAKADLLPEEYLNKARGADHKHNPVERKLVELREVRGNFGEVSEDTHISLCRV